MDSLNIALSLGTLIILEIVLGIDNLIFLSVLIDKLPASQRHTARRWGLSFAWITRFALLISAFYLTRHTLPLITLYEHVFSARDLFLLLGGIFLIVKATQEIHDEMNYAHKEQVKKSRKKPTFLSIILQVAVMDIIFSLDSVITAIGLTNLFWVMATAMTAAVLVMIYASVAVSHFIDKYPTIKMLALSFLILIGMVLFADGLSFHVPRGYVYFAMAFSFGVEVLNLVRQHRD